MIRQIMLKEAAVAEYLAGGVTYRELQAKYGFDYRNINRWVLEYQGKKRKPPKKPISTSTKPKSNPVKSPQVKEIERLEAEVRKARMENKLLNSMIDIAQEQLGVDIRKKHGAKRSQE